MDNYKPVKTTEAITVYIRDLDVIDAEIERRVQESGREINIYSAEFRQELVKMRKDILHEIVSRSKYGKAKK